ncbi:hypothetical protein SmJEL517_g03066 [Synchytrium microbalum]|uniref:Ribosomal eL28/Mak16 domain-containing protein n=1 Tax=Synchytrium microbalum TaxID=1806994 RepID=A0A507C554_9FUNG|nr:uncharacterized protein SmJEL517_g03066 [Synchytrium microbalum]TPX34249.1 hypothetical protein SmJEL517_g03066 [Synchytrium microbalum]
MSREPGNLLAAHSFKYSGIANTKTIDITAPTTKGAKKGVTVTKSSSKKSGKKVTTTVSRPPRSGLKAVRSLVKSYRPDLTKAAVARASRVFESQRTVKASKAKPARASRKIKA